MSAVITLRRGYTRPGMYDAMPDGGQGTSTDARSIRSIRARPRGVVRRVNGRRSFRRGGTFHPQGGLRRFRSARFAVEVLRGGSPASNSANLMLDEPPLIVRTVGWQIP